FSSRRRHTRSDRDWSSDVCSSDLNPLSIGMRTLSVFALCLVFALADGVAKQRHCTFRVHAQANSQDTEVFATSVRGQISGKNVRSEERRVGKECRCGG